MKETTFNKTFVGHMQKKWPYMWHMKIHGHEMQQSGIADDLFCINSVFAAIEFKIQRDGRISTTPMQMKQLNKVKNANGIGLFVAYDENIQKILVRQRRLDWRAALTGKSKKVSIKLDWDFEFNKYETVIDLIDVMVERK